MNLLTNPMETQKEIIISAMRTNRRLKWLVIRKCIRSIFKNVYQFYLLLYHFYGVHVFNYTNHEF